MHKRLFVAPWGQLIKKKFRPNNPLANYGTGIKKYFNK